MTIHDDPALRRIKALEDENQRLRLLLRRIQAACTMASSAGTIQELAVILDEVVTWSNEVGDL